MKKGITLLTIVFSQIICSQVGIGTPAPKATLDVVGSPSDASVLDGVIPPRITGDELRAKTYTTNQTGAIVYVTAPDSAPEGQTIKVKTTGYYFFTGSEWQRIDNNAWSIDGNAGTSSDINFLGTTDTQNLVFKVRNIQSGLIDGVGGKYSTSLGYNALNPLATGKFNSAFGAYSLQNNTTGGYNQAIGYGAMKNNTSGNWNVAFGYATLRENLGGTGNAALGHLSTAFNTTGGYNAAVGYNSLNRNTTGSANTAIGSRAMLYSTTGNYNIAIGANAGATDDTGFLNTGSFNILIGIGANVPNPDGDRQMNIGDIIYGTDIGPHETQPTFTGRIGIGVNNPGSTLEVNGAITNTKSHNVGDSRMVSFTKSNIAYSQAPTGLYTLSGIKDGGHYVLVVQNTTSGTATFTAEGFTVKVSNGPTTAGTETVYSISVVGTTAYVSMQTGYQ